VRLIPAKAFLVMLALYMLGRYVVKAFVILGAVPPLFPVGLSRIWQETAQVLAIACGA
jgi:hypothetical protein